MIGLCIYLKNVRTLSGNIAHTLSASMSFQSVSEFGLSSGEKVTNGQRLGVNLE
jgi:hypothetical protein